MSLFSNFFFVNCRACSSLLFSFNDFRIFFLNSWFLRRRSFSIILILLCSCSYAVPRLILFLNSLLLFFLFQVYSSHLKITEFVFQTFLLPTVQLVQVYSSHLTTFEFFFQDLGFEMKIFYFNFKVFFWLFYKN